MVDVMRNGKIVSISQAEYDAQNPPDPPKAVPTEIHAAWLRAALAEAGKGDAVNAAVAAQGPVSKALWEYATTIRRDDADVIAIAKALNLDLEALFKRADEIRAAR